MNYKVIEKDGLKYYQDENGALHGEGYTEAYDFKEGFAVVAKPDGVQYYINEDFEIISHGYGWAGDFHEGIAKVYTTDPTDENSLMYFINTNFEIISEGYYKVGDFSDGLAPVWPKKDGLMHYVNKNMKPIGIEFSNGSNFHEGFAVVYKYKENDPRCYYINQDGEIVSGPYRFARDFNNGVAAIEDFYNEWYYINKNFEKVGGPYRFAVIDRYLNGEIGIYDLPDECFVGDNLNIIIDNEKETYEYLINMAATEKQKAKIQKEFEDRADFFQGRAFEVSQDKTTEK